MLVDQIPHSASIFNNTGSRDCRSCIDDGPFNPNTFRKGDVVQVWTSLENGTLRGEFTISGVEFTFIRYGLLGIILSMLEGKRRTSELIRRIWSSDPLPAGTTAGDFLVVA